jgi:predicted DNA binding CopG/RHH family protein
MVGVSSSCAKAFARCTASVNIRWKGPSLVDCNIKVAKTGITWQNSFESKKVFSNRSSRLPQSDRKLDVQKRSNTPTFS